jgi:sporulation protein YlmC with PRC-barrel domain
VELEETPGIETPGILAPTEPFEEATETPVLPGTGDDQTPTAVVEVTPEVTVEETETPAVAPTEEVLPPTGLINPSRLDHLMDFEVQNQNGDVLGEVDNMVIDLGASRVAYVVIGAGGFLGIGEDTIPVPWDALTVNPACLTGETGVTPGAATTPAAGTTPAPEATPGALETTPGTPGVGGPDLGLADCFFLLNADDETLRNAPTIDLGDLPDSATPGWDAEFDDYWATAGTGAAPGAAETPAAETTPAMEETPAAGATPGAAAGQDLLILADQFLGMTVVDMDEENLGDVDDAIVDLDTGDIQYVVLGAGDALELGDQVILVPLQALQLNAEGDAFTINVDRETLTNAPSFDPDLLPDTTEENWDADLRDYWQDFVNQDQ